MANFIVTFTPYFKKSVLRELSLIDKDIIISQSFNDGIILIQSQIDANEFLNNLVKSKPMFIKHICPVKFAGTIKENLDVDKDIILNYLEKNDFEVLKDERFAVQTRIIAGGTNIEPLPYSSKDIEVYIGTYYTDKGGIPTFSDDKIINKDNVKILSIIINKNNLYIGWSKSEQNLNFSCDEYRISTKQGRRVISRAENKLIEALTKFNIELSGGVALDIGAAPGGWTKVLVDHGFDVVAVDPGDLHVDLQNHPKIKHYKYRIENLNFENHFDIIVNDMNVDPNVTSEIMNSLASQLKSNGLAIITFKLPNNPDKSLKEGIEIISKKYEVLNVTSLFHNRQEVTALIRKK